MKKILLVLFLFITFTGYTQVLKYGNSVLKYNNVVLKNFSPIELGSVIAWYDCTQGITKDGSNYISQWNDLSGNNYHLIQATGAYQPLWTTSSGIFFSSNDYFQKAWGTNYSRPYTIIIVWNKTSGNVAQYGVDGYSALTRHVIDYNDVVRLRAFDNAEYQANYSKTSPFTTIISTAIFNSASISFYENATLKSTLSTGIIGNASSGITVGARYSIENYLTGYIKEIVIYNKALTTAEITKIVSYLNNKYKVY